MPLEIFLQEWEDLVITLTPYVRSYVKTETKTISWLSKGWDRSRTRAPVSHTVFREHWVREAWT